MNCLCTILLVWGFNLKKKKKHKYILKNKCLTFSVYFLKLTALLLNFYFEIQKTF